MAGQDALDGKSRILGLERRGGWARGLRRWATNAARRERIARLRRLPISQHTVCHESFADNGALCNPEAIFRGPPGAPDLSHPGTENTVSISYKYRCSAEAVLPFRSLVLRSAVEPACGPRDPNP